MNKRPVEVNVPELESLLDKYLDSAPDVNFALKILGHPGVGKSALVSQMAGKKNFLFIDTRLAFKENVDLGGYPVPDNESRRMIYYRPRFIPPEEVPDGYRGIVWFLDEANRAHPTVIQTLFQIITERTCGEHRLPAKTAIVLAGNLGEADSTTITDFDDSALDGRLAVFHLRPRTEDWLRWAASEGIHQTVMHYLSLFPERLWSEERINPNPRGWHQASNAILHAFRLEDAESLREHLAENRDGPLSKLISSLLDEVEGTEFIAQVLAPRVISTGDILGGNGRSLAAVEAGGIPSEDLLWALTGALTDIVTRTAASGGSPSGEDITRLGNTLSFIAASRADLRASFLYRVIRDCGLLTRVPQAVASIGDAAWRERALAGFDELLRPADE